MATVRQSELESALNQVDFPAHKDDIIRSAEVSKASVDAQKALRTLPPVEYGNADEVIRSVTHDVGAEGKPPTTGGEPKPPIAG